MHYDVTYEFGFWVVGQLEKTETKMNPHSRLSGGDAPKKETNRRKCL